MLGMDIELGVLDLYAGNLVNLSPVANCIILPNRVGFPRFFQSSGGENNVAFSPGTQLSASEIQSPAGEGGTEPFP